MKIKIDDQELECKKGEVILDVALRNGINIPAICRHSDLKPQNSCRLCLIQIKGKSGFYTSCSTKVENGMEIITESSEIKRLRKTNLELLFAQHIEQCVKCNWNRKCKLLELAREYKIEIAKFNDRKKGFPTYQFGPSVIFDSSKCIDCRNCIAMCQKQGVGFLGNKEKNGFFCTVPSSKKECVYCGQCITHCPAGAFEEVSSIKEVKKALKGGNVVFQFAPAIRTSIGEEFGLSLGSITTGKLVTALKKLGGRKVFDVSFSADITTVEEGKEFIERLSENKNLPMFTSCCPSWVRYVEVYKPELIKHLTSVRSPHIISGGLIKALEDNPVVVSIMPCVAKKYEITREELNIDGVRPVDYVITTRELGKMIREAKIDFAELEESELDYPYGEATGAGVIYGATGGVMESALRTVYEKLTGKRLKDINLKTVRGLKGVKEAEIKIGKRNVKVAIINGLGNIEGFDYKKYDYIEVMACPGGCIGGGGQPVPINDEVRKKRTQSLYYIDRNKEIRLAHENPFVKLAYQEHLKNKKIIDKICHTTYGNNKNK